MTQTTHHDGPRWLGRPLVRRDSVDSTNREAWRHAEAGAAPGLVVVADEQTAGRGRLDRSWLSPRGEGVYASILLRPGVMDASAGLIGVAAAVAVAETVEDLGVERARIKWPNDVWVNDRKICGILVEARDAGRPDAAYVLGIGINVGQTSFPDGLRVPATSLRMETVECAPSEVLDRLLARLEPWLDATLGGREAALDAAFSARDALLGRTIEFFVSGEPIRGEVRTISVLGGLTLRLPDGGERTIPPDHVSEVTVVGFDVVDDTGPGR